LVAALVVVAEMRLLFLLVSLVVTLAAAKTFTKSTLKTELKKKKYGLDADAVKNWLCIAEFESSFKTNAKNYNHHPEEKPYNPDRNDHSTDFGIFQINNKYWCHDDKLDLTADPKPTTVSLSEGCGIKCSKLIDDDIADDIQCAKTIYKSRETEQKADKKKVNGYCAWLGYKDNCANDC